MNLPTKKTVDRYLKDYNGDCPYCDGPIESISEIVREHNCVWQDMQCATCGKIWRDEYKLESISVSTLNKHNQPGRWYSDEAIVVKDMYLHEYQAVIDEYNYKKMEA